MRFKMIIVFVEDDKTEEIMVAARKAGATGATVINNARGEGLELSKTFFRPEPRYPARRGVVPGRGTPESADTGGDLPGRTI